jgi:hypothetical protein
MLVSAYAGRNVGGAGDSRSTITNRAAINNHPAGFQSASVDFAINGLSSLLGTGFSPALKCVCDKRGSNLSPPQESFFGRLAIVSGIRDDWDYNSRRLNLSSCAVS